MDQIDIDDSDFNYLSSEDEYSPQNNDDHCDSSSSSDQDESDTPQPPSKKTAVSRKQFKFKKTPTFSSKFVSQAKSNQSLPLNAPKTALEALLFYINDDLFEKMADLTLSVCDSVFLF